MSAPKMAERPSKSIRRGKVDDNDPIEELAGCLDDFGCPLFLLIIGVLILLKSMGVG